MRNDGPPTTAGCRGQSRLDGLLQLERVLDRQLQKSEGGRDDLVLGTVATQRDELEVRVHSGFVEEEDASLKNTLKLRHF